MFVIKSTSHSYTTPHGVDDLHQLLTVVLDQNWLPIKLCNYAKLYRLPVLVKHNREQLMLVIYTIAMSPSG